MTSKSFRPPVAVPIVVHMRLIQRSYALGILKCRIMLVKRTSAEALNSLLLRTGDEERNPGPTQPCFACGGATTTKVHECVKCGARCHMMYYSRTGNEAALCQRLKSFICNHCYSSDGDQERCSVCRKGFRLHQHRAICNVCISLCHLVRTQLPNND